MGKLGKLSLMGIYFSFWLQISKPRLHIADRSQQHSCSLRLGEISGEVPIHIQLQLLLLLLMRSLNLRYQQCRMLKSTPRPPCSGITSGSTQCSQTLTIPHASSSSEELQTVWAFNAKYGYYLGKTSSQSCVDTMVDPTYPPQRFTTPTHPEFS